MIYTLNDFSTICKPLAVVCNRFNFSFGVKWASVVLKRLAFHVDLSQFVVNVFIARCGDNRRQGIERGTAVAPKKTFTSFLPCMAANCWTRL